MKELQTAELRWFLEQPLSDEWIASFPAVRQPVRHDFYLLGSGKQLGVKWREGNIEIKQQQGEAEAYKHSEEAEGYLEHWKKWSFPLANKEEFNPSDNWLKITKHRQLARFSYRADTQIVTPQEADQETANQCELEYTHLVVARQDYYTLGLEASGEMPHLKEILVYTVNYLAKNTTLEKLGLANSTNYAQWIRHHFSSTT